MAAFLDQSIFVSKKLTETIDNIIAKSDKLPVIIKSDHGRFLDPHMDEIKEKCRSKNFTALYLPGE